MKNNIGELIKTFSIITFVVNSLLSILIIRNQVFLDDGMKLLIYIITIMSLCMIAMIVYGFGEIVEHITSSHDEED